MVKHFKKITIYKFSLILYLFISIDVNASCEKEDINYYLEKGFTPDQITALCSDKIDNKKTKISLHGIIKNDTYVLLEKFISNLEIIDLSKKKAKTTGLNNSKKIDYLII